VAESISRFFNSVGICLYLACFGPLWPLALCDPKMEPWMRRSLFSR